MSDLIVIIPGIGGSVLAKGGQDLWNPTWRNFAATFLTGGEPFKAMTLGEGDRDDVKATGLINGLHVIPGFWSYGAYTPLTGRLRSALREARVVEFAYDWRKPNADSARALAAFITRATKDRPDDRVVLVGHSMGGLVARTYLSTPEGTARCRLLITIGTPYRGAGKALDVLANGINKVPGRTGQRLEAFLRSLPSVYELLPTYDCMVGPGETRQGLRAACPSAVSYDRLTAALEFHATVAAGLSVHGGDHIDTVAIVGQSQPTPTLARDVGGVVEMLPDATWAQGGKQLELSGDGTVPRGSAQPTEFGDRIAGTRVVTGRHLNLPGSPHVAHQIEAAIRGASFLALGPEEVMLGLDLPQVLTEGEDLKVRVKSISENLSLKVTVTDLETSRAVTRPPVRNDGAGAYSSTVHKLPAGSYLVTVEGNVGGGPRQVSEAVLIPSSSTP